ncbi:FtsX-like permease family protein [Arthrobacter crystallopoietes]|uniref:FtsX-like permease family protein n=1 Tax=Crystallibacter crystallopoietes TaxID=37928 RepID=UPI001ABE455F|nr:FtsX-like permease family protein [Arthrobacter crystallopoietes]QTG81540.1 FtsX-like permease family protein [Arthrobacter crystallopoietes]
MKRTPARRRNSIQLSRLSFRLAWRDILAHRARSLLIVALIALPVAALAAAATVAASTQPLPQETAQRELGQTQARLSVADGYPLPLTQHPLNESLILGIGEADPDLVPASLDAAAPDGHATLTESLGAVDVLKGEVPVSVELAAVDALDPAFAGKYELADGAAPGAGEVLASQGLMERLGIGVGDRINTADGSYTVSGVLHQTGVLKSAEVLYVAPAHPLSDFADRDRLYLAGDAPLAWAEVRALNRVGVVALSRAVIMNPPAAEDYADFGALSSTIKPEMVLLGAVAGLLALAETTMLAGAAFAVGVRKQRRALALLSATGAEASRLQGVVLSSGIILGGIAGFGGAVLGLGLAWLTTTAFHAADVLPIPGYHVPWPALALIALLGTVAALIAALVPARAVARQDAFAALRSSQAPPQQPARIRTALVLLTTALVSGSAGGLLAAGGSATSGSLRFVVSLVALGSAALCLLLGLVMLTGRVLETVASLAGRLPVPLRMAARDATRNRARSVPSIAAILAATAMATLAMTGTAAFYEKAKNDHHWTLQETDAVLGLQQLEEPASPGQAGTLEQLDHQPLLDAVEDVMGPVHQSMIISSVMSACTDLYNCTQYQMAIPETNTCPQPDGTAPDPADWRCADAPTGASGFPQLLVGGESELAALLGKEPDAQTLSALETGSAVLLNPVYEDSGKATIEVIDPSGGGAIGEKLGPSVVESHELNAFLTEGVRDIDVMGMISPQTADELGIPTWDYGLWVDMERTPTTDEADRVQQQLASTNSTNTPFAYEPGPPAGSQIIAWSVAAFAALVALTAAGITAGLALADGRADQTTLAGVGAAPRMRKALAAAQSLLTSGIGGTLGVVAGLLPAIAILALIRDYSVIVPWAQVIAVLIVVPLLGAVAAWLSTRSLPQMR